MLRRIASQRIECMVYCFVEYMPVAGRTRFDACFGGVPGGFQILDAGLGTGQVVLLDERGNVDGDCPELAQVTQF